MWPFADVWLEPSPPPSRSPSPRRYRRHKKVAVVETRHQHRHRQHRAVHREQREEESDLVSFPSLLTLSLFHLLLPWRCYFTSCPPVNLFFSPPNFLLHTRTHLFNPFTFALPLAFTLINFLTSTITMSSAAAAADDDYEHWPDDSKYWSKEAAPAPGYDENNGLHSHSYLPGKDPSPAKSPSPPSESEKAKSEASASVAPTFYAPQPLYMPQPSSIAHPNPQFYSHPQPMYGGFPPQGYYTYAQPGLPVIVPAPQPKSRPPVAAVTSAPKPANFQWYTPGFYGAAPAAVEEPKQPQPNTWQGRTKAQVEEDNMKAAKTEGVWDKRKVAPVGLADEQMCWVIELDGSHTLRLVSFDLITLHLLTSDFQQLSLH